MPSVFPRLCAVLLAAATIAGCSNEAKKSRLSKRAENYFKADELEKAKIEYLNLLRADSQNATAFQRLGLIWYEQGAPLRAVPFLLKARDLAPNDLQVRAKLAFALIAVGGIAEARKEAITILQQAPGNSEAILLLADTARTKEEIDETAEKIANRLEKNDVSFHLASANLSLRKGDMASAEKALQQALASDPKSPFAHLAMGNLYLLQKNPGKAGEEFKTAANVAPLRSAARLRYAEFKAQTTRAEEARQLLNELTKAAPDYLPAWRLLAQIALDGKKYDESLGLLENVFGRDPENLDARLLQAQVWEAQGDSRKVMEGLERLDKSYPNVPGIKYQLARAYLQNKNPAQANTALNRALALNPDYAEALLFRAELNFRAGEAQLAVTALVGLLKKRPDFVPAQLLLAAAYRSLGRLDDAAAVIREQIRLSPDNSQLYLLLGLIERLQNKNAEARKTFEKALELAPENLTVLYQIIDLDISEKNFPTALEGVRQLIKKKPDTAVAGLLEGRIYAGQGDWDRAEASLLKSIELDADATSAYDLLIAAYIAANKLPEALAKLEGLLTKNPRNARALMLSAVIYEKINEFTKARDAYEKLLSAKPGFSPALNNLAYLYAERLNQLDKASDLARKARTLQPRDAAIADTLGWILYKRGDYQPALALLQESAGKLLNNAEVQFHLGMASYMMNQLDAARRALQQAVNAPGDFPGKEEARRRLAFLGENSGSTRELSIDELKMILSERPDDLVAQIRLAAAYEKQEAFPNAAVAYEEALKLNPKLLSPTLTLAHLNAGPLANKDKALIYAKKARDLAPQDPEVAALLGRIAYESGNFAWAYSLLQESARERTPDAGVLHVLAWSAYSLGKVDEARQAMEKILKEGQETSHAENAKLFLTMTAFHEKPEKPSQIEAQVQQVLNDMPDYVPALMAHAAIEGQNGHPKPASESYVRVLSRFPDFAPAQKRLAALYLDEVDRLAEASDLARKARTAFPNDPETAKVLAEVACKKKEFAYAIQLFQESDAKAPLDARALYYLGISHLQVKRKAEGRKALDRALAVGLKEPLATAARRALAELSPE